jgi:hypothetical protein
MKIHSHKIKSSENKNDNIIRAKLRTDTYDEFLTSLWRKLVAENTAGVLM